MQKRAKLVGINSPDDLNALFASPDPGLRVRGGGLSPLAWLQRCAEAYPDDACVVPSGLLAEQDPVKLLKGLKEAFDAFDEDLGSSPNTFDPVSVANRRLLLGSLKKFRGLKADPTLDSKAVSRYIDNNRCAADGKIPSRFREGMRSFLGCVLKNYASFNANPHFGPGAVYERMSVVERWEEIWGVHDLPPYDPSNPANIYGWALGESQPSVARLCAVPKDWDKKRLITVEGYQSSYLQHWTRECLLKTLRHCRCAGLRRLASPNVWDPQEAHRDLAQRGSVDGSLATLDLSDASDLVSINQVIEVFPSWVIGDLVRARSDTFEVPLSIRRTDPCLPEYGDIHMFAGMGNATTFCVETLMFHAACHAIARYHRLGFKDSFISVFGDDMVVSQKLAELILDLNIFEEFGWKINRSKSFWRPGAGFRESCGGQYYNGTDVTLLRYSGAYRGLPGLVAYADLVDRCSTTQRWTPLLCVETPWAETPLENSHHFRVDGGLLHSTLLWPETCTAPVRWHHGLQRREVKLPAVWIPKRLKTPTGLGPVYGALSGQLANTTGHVRIRGRKAYGILTPVPNRARLVSSWFAANPIEDR